MNNENEGYWFDLQGRMEGLLGVFKSFCKAHGLDFKTEIDKILKNTGAYFI